jgi:hypothetical protein
MTTPEHNHEEVFAGIYRGIVVDPQDPTGAGRVKVKVTALNGEGTLGWAMPCIPFLTRRPLVTVNGASTDSHADAFTVTSHGQTDEIKVRLPKVGDAVWVMFEHGSIDFPVWLGTWLTSGGAS